MKNISWLNARLLQGRLGRIHRVLPAFPRDTFPGGGLSAPWHKWLDQAFTQALAPHQPVGAALALAYGGKPLALFTYGEAVRGERPIQEDTVFRIASISKAFGNLALMRLVEDGRLDLDGDIAQVLGFPVRHPLHRTIPITPRQLMTHTAGLRDDGDYDRTVGTHQMLDLQDLLARKCNFHRDAPGKTFHYSNLGAGILGALAEALTGQDLDSFFQDTLLMPLGMKASFHPQRIEAPLPMAQIYRIPSGSLAYDAAAIARTPLDAGPNPQRHYATLPGKLMISAPDALRLLLILLGHGTEDPPLLRPETLAEMRRDQSRRASVTGLAGRGLNVAIAPQIYGLGRTLYGHQGMAYGAVCSAWGDPVDGSALVLLTNGASNRRCGPVACIAQDVTASYYAAVAHWNAQTK